MATLLAALAGRRARRAFSEQPVPEDLQQLLWQAVQVAPSHGNAQPVRILVAESGEARERFIRALSEGNRSWAPAAPLLFALAVLPEHDSVMRGPDGSERELWLFHAGIAAGNLMAQATALGLIAHPMASFEESKAREAFAAPDCVRIIALFAAGYPGAAETLPADLQPREASGQERLPLEHLVAKDRWDERLAVSARDLRKRSR